MTYRESMEKPKQDQISEFVAYGEPCPYCECQVRMWFAGNADSGYKDLVKRRSWSFLWWRSHPAYYKVRCYQCKEYFKELLPVPKKQTL